jgi:eukaryotic-like serine/threonine-protein kinase
LGVTFYLLLTGTPPFRGDSPLALVRQIMDTEPADVSSLNPTVDAATRRILGRMIAKDRAQRYQSCHELVADLEEYLATHGVRSMTAGLATRVPSTSPQLAAMAAAPTQVLGSVPSSKADAQSAETLIQSKPESPTLPDAPLLAPNTLPNAQAAVAAAQPRRSSSRALIAVVVVALVLLLGGGIAAAVFGTRMFRSVQARWQHNRSDTASTPADPQTATSSAAATPKDGVLLLQTVKPPAGTTETVTPAPAAPAASNNTEGTPATGTATVTSARASAAHPARAPEQNAPVEKHRAGVAVAATGDAALLGAVSSVLRSELDAAGIQVVDAHTLPATEDLLRRGEASTGRLIDRLSSEGYAVLLLARVDPIGQRELSYYGRHDTAYTSRVTLTAYDLATGKPFGSSGTATVEYTSINADSASEEMVAPLAKSIARAIRSH